MSPGVAITDVSGVAKTTFTSGSLSTGAEGVTINASVVGAGKTADNNTIFFQDFSPGTKLPEGMWIRPPIPIRL